MIPRATILATAQQESLQATTVEEVRQKGTGNMLLYVHEVTRESVPTNQTKSYIIADIQSACVLGQWFTPRYEVEL